MSKRGGRKKHGGRPRSVAERRLSTGPVEGDVRPMETALLARQRIYGLSEDQAKNQYAETALGRLYLAHHITKWQRLAGEKYLALRCDAMKAYRAPQSYMAGNGKSADGDLISDEYVEWCRRVTDGYERALRLISASAPRRELVPLTAVNMIVVEDRDANWLIGDLRVGLDALIGFFGLAEQRVVA